MSETPNINSKRVLVTGASGFVGRYVVRELIAHWHHPVCLVRSADRFRQAVPRAEPHQYTLVEGGLFDEAALAAAARGCDAAIHLVGIIIESRWRGQTFHRVHVEGARRVVEACRTAGIARLVHMSALGTRPSAVSAYHRTKHEAELIVRASPTAWTIFRPSLIHGPDGEFMQLVRSFVRGMFPPVIPYFGRGDTRLQPVSVRDVAHCFVAALSLDATIGKVFELAGPKAYAWTEFYEVARRLIPRARRLKPKVSIPVPLAKAIGAAGDLADTLTPLRFGIPFNLAQVQMSQEDNTADVASVEQTFGIKMRHFEEELAAYAAQIR